MPPARALPILIVLAALLLGGCGEPAPVRSADRTLRFHLDEYRIVPQRVEVAAGRITISARNTGTLSHNLRLVRRVVQADGTQVEQAIAGTRTLQPGQTGSFTIRLEPGTYKMACTLSNHDNLGQFGELIVQDR